MRKDINCKKILKSIHFIIIFFVIIVLNILVCFNRVQGESRITKIVDNGDSSAHIDLSIIGSGFLSEEIDTYISMVNQNVDKMFTVNWLIENRTLFNVWRIDAISPESGVDLDEATIYSIASQTPYDILIVLHNYDGQESVVKPYIELYKSSHKYVVLAHELGHVIGKLDDEYCTSATAWKCDGLSKRTLNIHDKPSNEKWSDLISTLPYEGARFCETGLWRPSENSIMRDSADSTYFDAVGLKAMDLGAGKILGTVESNPPSLHISGVENGDTKNGILNVEVITSDISGIERVEFYWAKAGETSKSIKIDRIAPYDLVVDTAQYENGQYYLDTLSYDKNWNYVRVTRLFNIFNFDLNIPIITHEALSQNMTGMKRINEPLTLGIPLPEDLFINNINQLGLKGVDIQQFRPLAYWPNGAIKWVLVDTQISLSDDNQNAISLVSGTGNSPEIELAHDNGDYININTGPAQFRIKKSGFNLFDSVVVNGNELISPNNSGGMSMIGFENSTYTLNGITHTLTQNEIYDSKNDPDSTVVIEENGPVRAALKATGSFKDASGNRLMDYTVRFHFYKDKSHVKTHVIIRHGAHENYIEGLNEPYSQNARSFYNMQLSIPLNLGENKEFEFALKDSAVSGSINNIAYMFQASSLAHRNSSIENDKLDSTENWFYTPMERINENIKDMNYFQKGLEIKNGDTILQSLGDQSDWTQGFAEIRDQNNFGLSIAMLYMSSYWPASIEFSKNGNAEIGIFSKYNSKKDNSKKEIKMGWGTHETRILMLDFHTTPIINQKVLYRLEYPVVGRTSLEHYRQTRALFGQEGLVSCQDMDNWFLNNFGPPVYGIPVIAWQHTNNGIIVWRSYWYSGVEGTDWPLNYGFTFLKNGAGGRYMGGLQKTLFNADSAIERTDGFDYSETQIKTDWEHPINNDGTYNASNHFDLGHNHWLGMVLYYYLTGDEEIKEAIYDYTEEYIKQGGLSINNDLRIYSRTLKSIAIGYEFTKDERLKTILNSRISELVDSRDDPPNLVPHGRNMQRGYLFIDYDYFEKHFGNPGIHHFFLASVFQEDAWQALRILKSYDNIYPRLEELEDLLLGVSQYIYHESYLENSDGTDFGYPYEYFLHAPNTWIEGTVKIEETDYYNYMRKDGSSRAMWFAYLKTGDTKYLERGKKILAYGGGLASCSPFPAQDLIYTDIYGLNNIWNYVDIINVTHNGQNNYTLTWTVPEGTVAYKIKYSDKPIVDWLGYNQMTMKYEYSPDEHTAFFAAVNVDNEPEPAQPGTIQSFSIDIPQAINSYNTSRNLSSDNPSYITYNQNNSYYFSIKYLSNNNPPSASASVNLTKGTVPLTVNFSGSGSDQDGTIVSYSWDFGDGASSSEKNPIHTYNESGNYTATLTVTDDKGARDMTYIEILVAANDNKPPDPPILKIFEITIK